MQAEILMRKCAWVPQANGGVSRCMTGEEQVRSDQCYASARRSCSSEAFTPEQTRNTFCPCKRSRNW